MEDEDIEIVAGRRLESFQSYNASTAALKLREKYARDR
jgi:hypothetical protein